MTEHANTLPAMIDRSIAQNIASLYRAGGQDAADAAETEKTAAVCAEGAEYADRLDGLFSGQPGSVQELSALDRAAYRSVAQFVREEYAALPLAPSVVHHIQRTLTLDDPKQGGYRAPAAQQQLSRILERLEDIPDGSVDLLLSIPSVLHDFMEAAPFRAANGRTAMLLMTLMLMKSGIAAVKTVSPERAAAEHAADFTAALQNADMRIMLQILDEGITGSAPAPVPEESVRIPASVRETVSSVIIADTPEQAAGPAEPEDTAQPAPAETAAPDEQPAETAPAETTDAPEGDAFVPAGIAEASDAAPETPEESSARQVNTPEPLSKADEKKPKRSARQPRVAPSRQRTKKEEPAPKPKEIAAAPQPQETSDNRAQLSTLARELWDAVKDTETTFTVSKLTLKNPEKFKRNQKTYDALNELIDGGYLIRKGTNRFLNYTVVDPSR